MNSITDSKFAVWRCLIIMANIDGHFSEEEQKFLNEIHNYDVLSDEQKEIIRQDIDNKNTNFDSIYAQISEPRDRAFLINLTRVLFHKDGKFCPTEQDALNKIDSEHKKTINLEKVLKDARSVAVSDLAKHHIKVDEADDIEGGGILAEVFDYITDSLRNNNLYD